MTDEPQSIQDEIPMDSRESVENAPLVEPEPEEDPIKNAKPTEKELIQKKQAEKSDVFKNSSKSPTRRSRRWRFRPIRMIFILILIILLLLLLIAFFGLGGGGGKKFPGASDSPGFAPPKDSAQKEDTPAPKTEDKVLAALRWDLVLSFIPSDQSPATAQDGVCRFDWTDPKSKEKKNQKIVTGNMDDFESAMEKAIRTWRTLLKSDSESHIPVLVVHMSPFPGEGVFRKIESLARKIDERINIMRLEDAPTP